MSGLPRRWIYSDAQYRGGAEVYAERLMLGADPKEPLGLVAFGHPSMHDWFAGLRTRGIHVDVLRGDSNTVRSFELVRWARRRSPRLVHVNLPGPYEGLLGLAPLLLKQGGVRRIVVTEHLPSVGRVGRRFHAKRFAVRFVDCAIALCERHAELLRSLFGYRQGGIRTVPNGVELRDVPTVDRGELLGVEARGTWIVQVGALDERKGGRQLLRAMAQLAASGSNARLVFVGDGPQRQPWRAFADELGVGDRVHLVGHRTDALSFVAAADVVVLASHREGMPFSLLEAMALGRAVVATDVDGIPEMLDNGSAGRLVQPGDVEGLALALRELIDSAELRATLGERALARQREFYRERHMVAATLAIHAELLG